MRLIALALLATPAFAETPDAAFPPPAVDPALEARLVPAVVPRGDLLGGADEWSPGAARLAAIVGPDGLERGSYRMAETFDDAPLDEDHALARVELGEM